MVSQRIITEVSWCLYQQALLNVFLVQIGEPTILINNAGVVQGKLVLDLSVEDVQQYVVYVYQATLFLSSSFRTFGVNTFSHFWILKAFLPAMLKNKSGHIVSVFYYCVFIAGYFNYIKVFMSSALGMTGVAQMGKPWDVHSLGVLLNLSCYS